LDISRVSGLRLFLESEYVVDSTLNCGLFRVILSNRKVKLQAFITPIHMKIMAVLGAIAVAVLFFFSVIFALASAYGPQRLITSALLFIIGVAIVFGVYYMTRKPTTVIQRLEVSGQMKAASIKCPNCGGSVDTSLIKIVSGVPYATCPYCGTTFEVTEEPKW
jgi:DNA-directed RNA polymerase subunit RPC12/RpoP